MPGRAVSVSGRQPTSRTRARRGHTSRFHALGYPQSFPMTGAGGWSHVAKRVAITTGTNPVAILLYRPRERWWLSRSTGRSMQRTGESLNGRGRWCVRTLASEFARQLTGRTLFFRDPISSSIHAAERARLPDRLSTGPAYSPLRCVVAGIPGASQPRPEDAHPRRTRSTALHRRW